MPRETSTTILAQPSPPPMNRPIALFALFFASACGVSGGVPTSAPTDFAVSYVWRSASVPPPYHGSTRIEVGPSGDGEITGFVTTADGGDLVQTERFHLDAAARQALYAGLREAGVFSRRWRADDDPPVGGERWFLDATAGGETAQVHAVRGDGREASVRDVIEGAVPADARMRLRVWRVAVTRIVREQIETSEGDG